MCLALFFFDDVKQGDVLNLKGASTCPSGYVMFVDVVVVLSSKRRLFFPRS